MVQVPANDMAVLTAEQARKKIREGSWKKPTAGLASRYAQANLAILPQELAFDFLRFCLRNPRPCPVLEVTDPGNPTPTMIAPQADLRTDLPRYRIYRYGRMVEEVDDISGHWQNDLVAFLLGCSFAFEEAMLQAGIPVRHIEQGCNVPMFITHRSCLPAGQFRGPLVVSMRPIPADLVVKTVEITRRFPSLHGAPLHIGCPEGLGIADLSHPDFGDPVRIESNEIPVFWACGVTPQAVAMEVKPKLMITHAPGHMFVCDCLNSCYQV